jgi:hypothetical protein
MVSAALLGVGLGITLLSTGLVYADAARRNLDVSARLGWSALVAVVSGGGFLAVSRGVSWWYPALYRLLAGDDVVLTPTPWTISALILGGGLAIAAIGVLGYGFGSRYGPVSSTR